MKKLIIWDFDGVIADTEKLWVSSRMELLNRDFNLGWSFETTNKHIGGRSEKDKKRILQNLGIEIKDSFWDEAMKLDLQKLQQGIALTPGIEDIFLMDSFDQCIATGGTISKTKEKIKQVGIEKYFPAEKVFSADLVEYGKPEPDLFLLAAHTMDYKPEDCIVIEDSLAGLTAAQRAKMLTVAFVKYNSAEYVAEIKKTGVEHIFDDMAQVKKFILSNI